MVRWLRVMRIVLGVLFVVLALAYVTRSAVLKAYVDQNAALVEVYWPDHSSVLASAALVEVAKAAGGGEPVPPETIRRLKRLSEISPLSPEPFLVAGATAVKEGDYTRAERLLLHARTRAPRSAAARYLLADVYLRQNRIGPALEELAVIRRLVPALSGTLAPALAQYIARAGAGEEVRRVLREDPQLEDLLLTELAADPRNAKTILELARPHRPSEPVPQWHQRLVASLVEAGDYGTAYALWRRYASPSDAAANVARFQRSSSPSPFTWTFAENSAGSANADGNGLQIFFTGRENVALASKLVLLPPGSYLLSMTVRGRAPSEGAVSWSVTCLPEKQPIARLPIAASGQLALRFDVPSDCSAQRVELIGLGQTFPTTAELTILDFQVKRLAMQ